MKDGLFKCKMEDIVIRNSFKKTKPNSSKVLKKMKNIVKGGNINPIQVNKTGVLIDGYIDYLILKELGFDNIYAGFTKDVCRNNLFSIDISKLSDEKLYIEDGLLNKVTIVRAKHPGNSTIYTWRSNINNIKEGDVLLVDTAVGNKFVDVVEVEKVDLEVAKEHKLVLKKIK